MMLALPLHLVGVSALLLPPQHTCHRSQPLPPGVTRCTAVMANPDAAAESSAPGDPAGRWPKSWDKSDVQEKNPAFAAWLSAETALFETRTAPSAPPTAPTTDAAETASPETLAAPSAPPTAPPTDVRTALPTDGPTGYDGQWTASKVRSQFIEYFESKGHTMVPSSPVVPYDDPTLLFANAGMNQFKPLFVGQARPAQSVSHSVSQSVSHYHTPSIEHMVHILHSIGHSRQ